MAKILCSMASERKLHTGENSTIKPGVEIAYDPHLRLEALATEMKKDAVAESRFPKLANYKRLTKLQAK